MDYKLISHVKPTKHGPKTLLFAGIHGNEQGGIDVLKTLKFAVNDGSVLSVLCNMPAIAQGKRLINRNLNRLFGRRHKFRNQSTYEFSLASKLESLLQKSDYLLDIHNSNTPRSPLFLITEHHDLGKYFDVEYVCSGFDVVQPGGTDYFMNTCLGKVGVCLECGYLTDTPKVWLKEQITNFLHYTGNLSGTAKTYTHQKHCRALLCYKPKHKFTAVKVFTDFEKIEKGACIGHDGKTKITAPSDGFVLFVKQNCLNRREAFIFGEFIDYTE